MKEIIKKTIPLVIVLSFLLNISLNAQWIQTNGPYGGASINCFATNDSIIYVGTFVGFFMSTNNGLNWVKANNLKVNDIALKDSIIFLGNGAGMYISTDSGFNYTSINNGLLDPHIYAITVKDSQVFAATSGGGIFRSANNGDNWEAINNGLETYSFCSLHSTDSMIYAGSWSGDIYSSSDNGDSWDLINNGLPSSCWIRSIVEYNSMLFIGTNDGPIYISYNYGQNWSAINNGLPTNLTCYSLLNFGDKIFAGLSNYYSNNEGGIYVTSDYGSTWNPINNGLISKSIRTLALKDSVLFVGTMESLYLSANEGETWIDANTGIIGTRVRSIVQNDSSIYVGTNNGIHKTTNNGFEWIPVNNGLTNPIINSLYVNDTNIFTGTWKGGVYLSSNNAENWISINNNLPSNIIYSLTGINTQLFVSVEQTSAGGVVFTSTDNGTNWTQSNTGGGSRIQNLFTNESYLYACDHWYGIYLSTNNGISWSSSNSGFPTNENYVTVGSSLALNNNELYAAVTTFESDNDPYHYRGVYYSSDFGANWTQLENTLELYPITIIDSIIFANAFNGFQGILYASTDGIDWTNINNGFPASSAVRSIIKKDSFLYAGTYPGVWKIPIDELNLISSKHESKIENEIVIFPNPTRNNINIHFENLPYEKVSINIYDLLGNKVFTEIVTISNTEHKEIINLAHLRNGLYIVHLEIGERSYSEKIVIEK